MKKIITCVLLAGIVFLASGCLIINRKCPPQGDPAVVFPCDQDPVIEEIDAVSKLQMSSDRQRFYKQIAQRNPLCESGQLALVKAAYRNLQMSNSKVDVLLTLIANPSFSPGAKSAILRDINKLHMSSDKAEVLDAIGKRGSLRPPAPSVIVVEETDIHPQPTTSEQQN